MYLETDNKLVGPMELFFLIFTFLKARCGNKGKVKVTGSRRLENRLCCRWILPRQNDQLSNRHNRGGGGGGEETRSGTEKQCSHNLTTCKAVTLREGQRIIALFPTVNIFRLFRSKKRTGRGNQKCLKN